MGTMGTELDLENRDPNNLNEHLQVMWEDVIGEPSGMHSNDKVWQLSYRCFRGTKTCCYTVMAAIFAPCVAFCMGCNFACLAFQHIWCLGPCLRAWKFNMAMFKNFWEVLAQSFCAPCCQACGHMCSQIRLRYQSVPESDEFKSNVLSV